MRIRSTVHAPWIAAAIAAALTLSLSACGGHSGSSSGNAKQAQAQEQQQGGEPGSSGRQGGNQPGGQSQRQPGAQGTIAAWANGVAQVQDSDSQTAVTVSNSTKITQQVKGTFSDIKAGSCVMASAATTTKSSSAKPTTATKLAATSIRVLTPSSTGECSAFPGSGGGGRGDTPSDMPSGHPSGMPSGGPGGKEGGFGGGNMVFGTVKSVSGTTLTITPVSFGKESRSTSTTTVTTTSSTTVTATKAATSSDIKVGLCASAQGKSDNQGGLTATSLEISAPTSSQGCVSRPMNRNNGGSDGDSGSSGNSSDSHGGAV